MKHVIKKAVIVGASSGMGLEVARLLCWLKVPSWVWPHVVPNH